MGYPRSTLAYPVPAVHSQVRRLLEEKANMATGYRPCHWRKGDCLLRTLQHSLNCHNPLSSLLYLQFQAYKFPIDQEQFTAELSTNQGKAMGYPWSILQHPAKAASPLTLLVPRYGDVMLF